MQISDAKKQYKMLLSKRLGYLIIFGILLVFIFYGSMFRGFLVDEYEVVHTAWKIAQGEKIYIDFFQHHHPFLYYSLVPIILITGDDVIVLMIARMIMFILLVGVAVSTYCIAKSVYKKKEIALLSTTFLLSTLPIINRAIEIRPDTPQVLFGLLSVLFFFIVQ